MTPEDLREALIESVSDTLDELGLPEIADAIAGAFFSEDEEWLDKAKDELHNSMRATMKKIVRLATRLDYLEKGNNA